MIKSASNKSGAIRSKKRKGYLSRNLIVLIGVGMLGTRTTEMRYIDG
jgi:hypothetical protein